MMRKQSSSKFFDTHPIRVREGRSPDPTKDSPYRKDQQELLKYRKERLKKERETAAQSQAQMRPQD